MLSLRNRDLNVGVFLNLDDNLTNIILDGIDLGIYTIFFSLGNNRDYNRKRINTDDLDTATGLLARYPSKVYSILPSMYNLCGNRKCLAWNGNVEQDTILTKHLREIEYEMDVLRKLNGTVLIELGSFRLKDQGLTAASKSISKLDFGLDDSLVILNSLDSYSNVGITLKDMGRVLHRIDSEKVGNVSVGLQLAYFHVNGLYNLTQTDEIQRLLNDYYQLFGKNVEVIMLSDCSNGFRSKEYDAVPLGTGELWSKLARLEFLLERCREYGITILVQNVRDLHFIRNT